MEGYDINLVGIAIDSVSQIPNMMYRWDFGDGNSTDWQSSATITHNYTRNGLYSLVLEVRDPGGKVANNSTSVSIEDSVPQVDFEWSPLLPIEGQEISFVDRTWSYDDVVRINWSIDGQLVNSGTNHSITWTLQNGTYSVALEVTDYEGSVGTLAKSLTVLRSPPQILIIGPSSAIEDDEVNFTVQLDPWHSGLGDAVQSYEWNFSYTDPFVPDEITTGNWTSHAFVSLENVTNYTMAVRATDNDGDQAMGFFNITVFDRTKVSIVITSTGPFYEFDTINFTVVFNSSQSATLFEWQFDAIDIGQFSPDEPGSNSTNNSHVYGQAGNFLLLVNATVSNGSSAIGWLLVTVLDVIPAGVFEDYVTWERNPANTSQILFRANSLAVRYPDIAETTWQFGDGTTKLVFGGPLAPVVHYYAPSRTYQIMLIVTDDDSNSLALTSTLRLNAPTIVQISPVDDSVIMSGIPIRFLISDDSPPMVSVHYALDGGPLTNFTAEWEISTTSWSDGFHSIVVSATDGDGNIAVKDNITVVIDDLPPALEVLWIVTSVYGGDSMNISVKVTDPHTDDGSIFLHVKLPGAKSYSQVLMHEAGDGIYFAVIEVPKRSGTLLFHVSVGDLAQNSATSGLYSVNVKLHFIDIAWPFLLALAVIAALGTAGYFVREVETAVDETFVIYNDGRLISHSTRHLKPEMDDQVLSGMLVAIQDFIRESFKDITSFTLRKLEFGDKSILIEKGDHLFLAVILHGKASKKVASKMQQIVDEIEEEYSLWLKNWDGDLDTLRGVGDVAKKLYSKAPLLPPFLRRNT